VHPAALRSHARATKNPEGFTPLARDEWTCIFCLDCSRELLVHLSFATSSFLYRSAACFLEQQYYATLIGIVQQYTQIDENR
jgi:hypothetical protein